MHSYYFRFRSTADTSGVAAARTRPRTTRGGHPDRSSSETDSVQPFTRDLHVTPRVFPDGRSFRSSIESETPLAKRRISMERKIVDRRTVLKGGAAAVGMLGGGASASMVAGVAQASADTPRSLPDQILTAVQRFREAIPANFDHEYVEKVVRPF